MFVKQRFLAVAACLAVSFANIAAAQHGDAPSVQVQTQKIITAVKKYSEAISCTDAVPKAQNIAAMVPYTSFDNRLDAKFAVVWFGDIGCAGGSGTSGAAIAVVRVGAGDNFYVSPEASSPQIDDGLPRHVEKVVGATADSITVDVRDYGDKDPNCCPTLRKRVTLRQSQKGNWAVISTQQLPPAKY